MMTNPFASVSRWVWVGLCILFLFLFLNLKWWRLHPVITYDVVSYHAYLPALVIENDPQLHFIDTNPDYYADKIWYQTAPNGGRVIKTTMGTAWGYAPFWLVAHACAINSEYTADGFSLPYRISLLVAGLFWGLCGLWFLRKLLLLYVSDRATAITLCIIALGSNLFTYITSEAAMSHSFSFALFAAWFYLLFRMRAHPQTAYWIGLSLLGGLLVLVRPTHILVLLPALSVLVVQATPVWQFFSKHPLRFAWSLLAILPILPQVWYWKNVTGEWIFYSYGNEQFFWSNPHLAAGLWSWRKGWWLYSPLMALLIPGIWISFKNNRFLGALWLFLTGLTLYVTFSWWCWWYGGGFGQRSLIDHYAWMAIPIAWCVQYLIAARRLIVAVTGIVFITLISLSVVQNIQYRYQLIHHDSMTKAAYFYTFVSFDKRKNIQPLLHPPDYDAALKGQERYAWD